MPEVCRKVVERAKVEEGKCENISIDWESARWTRTKEENDKKQAEAREEFTRKAREGKLDGMDQVRKSLGDLVVTRRVWIKGRGPQKISGSTTKELSGTTTEEPLRD